MWSWFIVPESWSPACQQVTEPVPENSGPRGICPRTHPPVSGVPTLRLLPVCSCLPPGWVAVMLVLLSAQAFSVVSQRLPSLYRSTVCSCRGSSQGPVPDEQPKRTAEAEHYPKAPCHRCPFLQGTSPQASLPSATAAGHKGCPFPSGRGFYCLIPFCLLTLWKVPPLPYHPHQAPSSQEVTTILSSTGPASVLPTHPSTPPPTTPKLQMLGSYVNRGSFIASDRNPVECTESKMEWDEMGWRRVSGMGWNGVEWDGMGWSGVEWSGVDWDGMQWSGVGWDGMEWSRVGWDGAEWDGMG